MNIISVFYEHIAEASEQNGKGTEEMLREVRDKGITGLECDAGRLSAAPELKELFRTFGMKTVSVYMNYDFGHETKERSMLKILKHLDLCAEFGAGLALCVPGFITSEDDPDEIMSNTASMLKIMCGEAKERGITVTIEDFDDINSPCCGTKRLSHLLNEVPELRLTFDTGNFAYCLEDTKNSYSVLKNNIAHVHLKERTRDSSHNNERAGSAKKDAGGSYMYPSPIGDGYIGNGEIIETMLKDGYKGAFSIEHFGAPDQLDYICRSADFINGIIRNWRTE